MQKLKTLIELLEKNRRIHVSILDLSGILGTPETAIDFKNVIHTKEFCNIAKSTERGYRTCMLCKRLANTKAVEGMRAFSGYCSYGLFEAAVPVVIDKTVAAIVYVGNAVVDVKETKARIKKTCKRTGVSEEALIGQLENCEMLNDHDELHRIADIISDYIKLLCSSLPKGKSDLHWLVSSMKNYAHQRFCYSITLRELAIIYQKNEQYLGRLFKAHMGVGFNEYCMELRLKKAERLLTASSDRIIDIALECGFNNISYFNRVFKDRYGVTPTEYKKRQV